MWRVCCPIRLTRSSGLPKCSQRAFLYPLAKNMAAAAKRFIFSSFFSLWVVLSSFAAALPLAAQGETADRNRTVAWVTFDSALAFDERPWDGDYAASTAWVILRIFEEHNISFSLLEAELPKQGLSVSEFLEQYPLLLVSSAAGSEPIPSHLLEPMASFVEGGGALVWTAAAQAFNASFNLGLGSAGGSKSFKRTDAASEGPFAEEGPAVLTRLENLEAVSSWKGEVAVCHYADGEDCAVLYVPFGDGVLVYLASSFLSTEGDLGLRRGEAEERDIVTKDWKTVLVLALQDFLAGQQGEDGEGSESRSQGESSESESSGESEGSSAAAPLPPFLVAWCLKETFFFKAPIQNQRSRSSFIKIILKIIS